MSQEETLKVEKNRFIEAIQFLKKNKTGKQKEARSLYKTPWHITLGTEKSGKITLLLNSELHFYLSRTKNTDANHQELTWWVSKNAAYLNIPYSYFRETEEKKRLLLTRLIRRYSYKKQIQTINLVIDIKKLIQSPEKLVTECKPILAFVNALNQQLKQTLPVYLTINKCDLISGFQEFFDHYAKDERQQPWGFLIHPKKNETTQANIDANFNQLIQRLNRQLITRLHHEPNVEKRNAIKDFPVQFAHIKQSLTKLTDELSTQLKKSTLAGAHFTSSIQSTVTTQNKSLNKALTKYTANTKPYFIHELLSHILPFYTKTKKERKASRIFFWLSSLVSISIATIVAVSLSTTFIKKDQQLQNASQLVKQYQNSLIHTENSHNIAEQTEAMKNLHSAEQVLNDNTYLKNKIHRVYNTQLNNLLIPTLKQSLENTLIKSTNNPSLLYAALKSYWMLKNPKEFDKDYFYRTIKVIWQSPAANISTTLSPALLSELKNALKNNTLHANIDNALMSNTRMIFSQFNTTDLAFIILKSYFINVPLLTLNLSSNQSADNLLSFRNPKLGISALYTPQIREKLSPVFLQETANETLHNLILGNITQTHQLTTKTLADKLQQIYFTHYTQTWQAFVDNITIKQPKNLKQLKAVLEGLSEPNSQLDQFVQLIKNNLPKEALEISPELTSIVKLDNQGSATPSLTNLHETLVNLNQYANTKDPDALLNTTKQRILSHGLNDPITQLINLSSQYTPPLQSWLYQIAMNTWKIMLKTTASNINQNWHKNIWPAYQAQIFNRYPFNANANNEVSLDSFTNFFSPHGLMDDFFTGNILPFIDTTETPWRLKNLNGLTLPIRPSSLQQFATALIFRRVFFPYHDQHIAVNFSIMPKEFSRQLFALRIKMGEQQTIFYNHRKNLAFTFHWPDEKDANLMEIDFAKTDRTMKSLTFKGPWAAWQWMQANQLKQDAENKQWIGTTTEDDNTIEFIMTTTAPNNPFDFDLFEHFKLEQNLS